MWRVEVKDKNNVFDAVSVNLQKDILDIGIKGVSNVEVISVYEIWGEIKETDIKKISEELLTDKITQVCKWASDSEFNNSTSENKKVIEVIYKDGVMDPVEDSIKRGIRDMDISGVERLRNSKKYVIEGDITDDEFKSICEKLLYNKIIQYVITNKNYYGTPEGNLAMPQKKNK